MNDKKQEGETIFIQHFIENNEFPKDLKYYHTNDGVCRYSAFNEWLTDDNQKRNPTYWLEPITHHRGSGGYGLSDEEIVKAFSEIYNSTDKEDCSIQDIMTKCVNWLNHFSNQESKKGFSLEEVKLLLDKINPASYYKISHSTKGIQKWIDDSLSESLTPKEKE